MLAELDGTKHSATILLSGGRKLGAEFALHGSETYVNLYSESEFSGDLRDSEYLVGSLTDGTKVSFVKNLTVGNGYRRHGDGAKFYYVNLQPQLVMVGHQHFNAASKLKTLSVLVDDAPIYTMTATRSVMCQSQNSTLMLS